MLTHFPNTIRKESKNSIDMDKAISDKLKVATEVFCDKFLAVLMLNGANSEHGRKLCHWDD